jgi:hypothetical protein
MLHDVVVVRERFDLELRICYSREDFMHWSLVRSFTSDERTKPDPESLTRFSSGLRASDAEVRLDLLVSSEPCVRVVFPRCVCHPSFESHFSLELGSPYFDVLVGHLVSWRAGHEGKSFCFNPFFCKYGFLG